MKRRPNSSCRLGLALLASLIVGACSGPSFVSASPPESSDPILSVGHAWVDEAGGGGTLAFDSYGESGVDEPAILFLHGWCENRGFWKPTATALQADTLCVSVDLPGYGSSSDLEGKPDPVAWAERVARLALSVHDGPWVVVGHALGGVVALETARILQATNQGRGVVVVHGLYDPIRELDHEIVRAFSGSLEKDYPGQINAFVDAMVPPRSAGALSGWVADQMQSTDKGVAVAGLGALEHYDLPACLKALNVPVRAINAKMRTTHVSANKRLIGDFEVYVLDSIEGPGLDLMLQDPVGFRELLHRALQDFSPATSD
ncbi:MAG: pimeloyl-ACP methyl ester carboxylesterase [Glaciecola sp.]|jgi:pimeloyl-ACP methyl ester carboxylesterase